MRVIRVVGFAYTTIDVVNRTFPVTIRRRQVNLRVRRCSDEGGEPIRLSVITSTHEHLPSRRRVQGCNIQSRRLPDGNSVVTIEFSPTTDLPMIANQANSKTDSKLGPAIMDLLDQVLPEYRFE